MTDTRKNPHLSQDQATLWNMFTNSDQARSILLDAAANRFIDLEERGKHGLSTPEQAELITLKEFYHQAELFPYYTEDADLEYKPACFRSRDADSIQTLLAIKDLLEKHNFSNDSDSITDIWTVFEMNGIHLSNNLSNNLITT